MCTIFITSWLVISGRWDWFSYYIRFFWIVPLIVAIFLSWRKVKRLPNYVKYDKGQIFSIVISAILIFAFGFYNVFSIKGFFTKDEAIELSFPLKDGTYYVAHGGNSALINYHNEYESQQYAIDVVKLNRLGMRANGLYPKQLGKYAIYGETLYSPCSGEVMEMENNHPDLVPPETDQEHAPGNYIALKCKNTSTIVYIAHMQKGSVLVDVGDSVEADEPIGKVGNSGNTTEPHLHIHAEKDGIGQPIRFENRFLKRNSLVSAE